MMRSGFALVGPAPNVDPVIVCRARTHVESWGGRDLPLLERLMGDPRITEHLGGPESPARLPERRQRAIERHTFATSAGRVARALGGAGKEFLMPWSPRSDFLRYDVQHVDGRATVRLAGELDLTSHEIVHRALQEAASTRTEAILDLSRVTFIDGAGLRCLLTAQRDACAANQRLIIRRPPRALRRLLDLTGLWPLLELEEPSHGGRAVLEPSRDVVAICNAAIDAAMRIDGASMANAQLFDPQTRSLRIIAQRGFKTDFLEFFEIVEDDESACGTALNSGRSVWVRSTAASTIFAGTPALDVMLDAGSRAVASVPVMSPRGGLIAMISTHHNRRPTWTNERKLKLEALARSTGRVLHDLLPTAYLGRAFARPATGHD
jgi:anti-anti-sigma factor